MKTFFGKSNSLFGEVSPKTCKKSFLNSPIFSFAKPFFLKAHKVPEKKKKKDVETYLEPSRTLKMELCAELGHDF